MSRLLEVEDLKTRIRLRSGTVRAVDGLSASRSRPGRPWASSASPGAARRWPRMSIMRLLPRGAYIGGGAIRFGGRDLVGLTDEEIRKVRGNEIGMVFQDPMTSLNPTMTIGRQIAEAVTIHRDVSKATAMERAVEALETGRPSPSRRAGARLPPPALGRPAPAGHDRHGPGLRTQAADRRRAHHRARRDHPGPDPPPARGDQARPRHGDHPDHPRHGGDRRAGRSRGASCTPAARSRPPRPASCSPASAIPTPRRCWPRSPSSTRTRARTCTRFPGSRRICAFRHAVAGSRHGAHSRPSAAATRTPRWAARTPPTRTPAFTRATPRPWTSAGLGRR